MDKSYVSLEAKVCPVCGVQHNHDCGILLDRRLTDSMERTTVTGAGLCEEHDKLWKDGYIALVEADPEKSTITKEKAKMQDAYRTGRIAHIKKDIFNKIVNTPISNEYMVFVDLEFIDKITNHRGGTK